MTYKALYRTWRPQTFQDIVGQQHITRTLQNALANNRVAHAYLFCGPRGTGKTTTAKVLAKALNCLGNVLGEPCNQCENCLGVTEGSSVDVIEIDAASNRGIDEIRDLREKVKFAPAGGRQKVYIIDEVHMLTDQAFNALLKTLEEPPAHVVFVLATTEAHKVPVTILSRCQRFDFRRIKPEEIIQRLRDIALATDIKVEEEALRQIAKASGGGLRDALSILDQAATFAEDSVTEADIHSILGTVQQDVLVQMTEFLARGEAGGALGMVAELSDRGKDLRLFAKEMTSHLRGILVESIEGTSVPKGISKETLFALLQLLVQAEQEMKWSSHPSLVLELALIKCSQPDINGSLESLARRVADLEQRLCHTAQPAIPARDNPGAMKSKLMADSNREEKTQAPITAIEADRVINNNGTPPGTGVSEDKSNIIRQAWPELLKGVKDAGKTPLWDLLSKGQPALETKGQVVTLYFEEDFDFKRADKPEYKRFLEWLISKKLGGQWEVRCAQGKKPSGELQSPFDSPVYTQAVKLFGPDIVVLEDDFSK